MTCENFQEMLSTYHDKELSAENEKAVKTHLEGCARCREEERRLSASWEILGELKPIEPSSDFQARFWAKVRREESNQTRWRTWLGERPLLPATLGLAGMAAVWILGVAGGVLLVGSHGRRETLLSFSSSVLTSPYPPHSIEQVFLQK